jgi:hypothetical protein
VQPTIGAWVLVTAPLLCGCADLTVGLGWRFGPGFSMRERQGLFAEAPVVEHRGRDYFLTWKQGEDPFFFQPDYRAIDGRLLFAVAATASSGSIAAGTRREIRIEGAENLEALRHGGAYWWEREPEPRGSLVPLKVVDTARP